MCLVSLARDGGRALQSLSADQRMDIINNLANSLIEHQADILAANSKDLALARQNGELYSQGVLCYRNLAWVWLVDECLNWECDFEVNS